MNFLNEAVKIHQSKELILYPGKLISDPISAISLGLALIFGTAGLPHILMRFLQFPTLKVLEFQRFYATSFIDILHSNICNWIWSNNIFNK